MDLNTTTSAGALADVFYKQTLIFARLCDIADDTFEQKVRPPLNNSTPDFIYFLKKTLILTK
jgi:hypothetical protein